MSELTYENFPSMPREGQSFTAFDMKIIVWKMYHNRILRLKVRKMEPAKGGEQ